MEKQSGIIPGGVISVKHGEDVWTTLNVPLQTVPGLVMRTFPVEITCSPSTDIPLHNAQGHVQIKYKKWAAEEVERVSQLAGDPVLAKKAAKGGRWQSLVNRLETLDDETTGEVMSYLENMLTKHGK